MMSKCNFPKEYYIKKNVKGRLLPLNILKHSFLCKSINVGTGYNSNIHCCCFSFYMRDINHQRSCRMQRVLGHSFLTTVSY